MSKTAIQIAIAAALLTAGSAAAQIFNQGIYQLPADDFTFTWGDIRRRTEVIDLRTGGVEEDFRCDLLMELRPGSRLGDYEMRQLEGQLSTQLDFIYQSAIMMNQLEDNRELLWATLTCKKGGGERDPDEVARAERETKARERALRAQQRRREREAD
jgi:hypothetical protein